MRKRLWQEYQAWKETYLKISEKEKEEKCKDDMGLRMAIYLCENERENLTGMLMLMKGAGVISEQLYEEEKKEIEYMFDPKRIYGASVLFSGGELIRHKKMD